MRTLVPFDARNPNSRLEPVLDASERRGFAVAMLRDVLDVVRDAGGDPVVLATADLDFPFDGDTPVVVDDRPLSEAVGEHLGVESDDDTASPGSTSGTGTAVVMSDLAIATPAALRRAFERPEPGAVAAAPGLGGGTNVLVVRHPDFRPTYHGTSFDDHRRVAADLDAPFHAVDSFRLAVDVDTPGDLAEVLVHGRGRATDWLEDAGFSVRVADGRTMAVRE